MENQDNFFFTSVKAEYSLKTGYLAALPDVELVTEFDDILFKIRIIQQFVRIIVIQTEEPVHCMKFTKPLYCLERLLMVFDGAFIPLGNIQFSGQKVRNESIKGECETQVIQQRLSYFNTSPSFTLADKLMDYSDVIDQSIFEKWISLLDELDIVNQMYLYTISDSHMPVDFRLAFLTELAESMVDIVNVEKGLFPSLKPGERGTSLKQCLNALVNTYGRVIFEREMKDDYDSFLTMLVNSRVRIMHIKRKQNQEKYFDGNESARYMMKMSLLYRVVLLDLLEVDKDFEGALRKITNDIDRMIDNNKLSENIC